MKPYADKREVLVDFLAQGLCMIHVDSRHPECVVPKEYQGLPALRLNLSYRFEGADIDLQPDGVSTTLTFDGKPFRCWLPWKSIYGITSKLMNPPAAVFPDDVPPEVRVVDNRAPLGPEDKAALLAEAKAEYAEISDDALGVHVKALEEVLAERCQRATKTEDTPVTKYGFGVIKGGKVD